MKAAAKSYCVTFEVKVSPSDLPEIARRTECARQIYNTSLGRCLKRWHGVRSMPAWRSALKQLQTLNRKDRLSADEKSQQTTLRKQLKEIEQSVGLSEYALHAYVLKVNQHFGLPLGSNEIQKAATFAWRTFERYRYGNAKKVHFKRRGDPITIENKTNRFGLRLKDDKVLWGSSEALTLEFPLLIKRNDVYAQLTFLDRTKYIRFFERSIRGKRRFFIQAVKEGTPPVKNRQFGEGKPPIGIDLSPSTLVAYSPEGAVVEELAPDCQSMEASLRRLNRAIERSQRATNPEAYNENGTFKKGCRLVFSKRCQDLKAKRQELFRKQAVKRKQSHEAAANKLIAQSTDIKVEDTAVTSWTARSKKTSVNRKNGKIRSKKRFGKAVARRAPAMLLEIIDRKLKYRGYALKRVVSRKVKASQFDHSTGQYRKKRLCDRWCVIDGHRVQRDLYSAFLISHVTGKNLDAIDRKACCDDWMNFVKLQDEALKTCDKSLGIF